MKMKKRIRLLCAALVALLLALCLVACAGGNTPDGSGDEGEHMDTGLIFTVNADNTTYTVSGYNGSASHIIIPSTYKGGSVTSIGDYAFSGCTWLTSITIPDSVTSIGDGAFGMCYKLIEVYNCSSLKLTAGSSGYGDVTHYAENVYTPTSGASKLIKQGDYVFYNDNGSYYLMGYTGNDTAITLPKDINGNGYSIYQCAFYNCTSLTNVTIPDSVTSIGNSAFYRCTGLTSVTIPDSVTSIEHGSFQNCTGLTSITVASGNKIYHSAGNCIIGTASKTLVLGCKNSVIPSDGSVTSIGYAAFEECTGLTSITIPDSVTSIGYAAFEYCTGLTSITIPDSVTSIGNYAFYGCTELTSIIIPDSVTSIETFSFGDTGYYNNENSWNNGVLYIGKCLIDANTSLSGTYAIKEGTICIGFYAFYECTELTSIIIPDSVTSIGNYAFEDCTGLTAVTIPDSVTSIGNYAFYGCTGLSSITVASGNKKYHSAGNCIIETASETLFLGCKNSVIPTDGSVTSIGYAAFFGCKGLTSITIGNSVTSIGDHAFYGCTGLTSITIPDSVTSIGVGAFSGCKGLTSITIGNSVTSIGDYAFSGCTGLTSITIPNSVKSIRSYAFYDCTGLSSVTIPNSVTSIRSYAFSYCTGLTSIKYRGSKDDWIRISMGSKWDYYTGSYNITYNYTGE